MTAKNPTAKTAYDIAQHFHDIADLLEAQDANPHRIRAYRTGARRVLEHGEKVIDFAQAGDVEALRALPGIGTGLGRLIIEYVETGRSRVLQRLQGEVAPEDLFDQVPGIGHELAERIVKHLQIKSLEELERAAHDGRLHRVPGFGRQRVRALQANLAEMLRGARARNYQPPQPDDGQQPPVDLLLQIDARYRQKAAAGQLRKIAPRRFNPQGKAWLPILHAYEGDWHFTALFSNTARAHQLGKTNDWVVIFYDKDHLEGQCTVVTETSGPKKGRRVVRGREKAC